MKRLIPLTAIILGLLLVSPTQAGFMDKLKGILGSDDKSEEPASQELTSEDRIAGLKEALGQGVSSAITTLGTTDGFWADELVKIALPDQLQTLAKTARKLGADKYVDQFHQTLNRAAEQAVPAAADIFGDAIKNMTIEDAVDILSGPDDAATQYFRGQTEASLKEQFQPIVTTATNEAGVTQAYKNMQSKAGGVMSLLGGSEDMDLDTYVTDKTLDGLFFYVAAEEKKIRENPIARTTDLLKMVFGS